MGGGVRVVCEWRSEAFVKIQKKNYYFFWGGGGSGRGGGGGGGGGVRFGGSGWMGMEN